MRIADGKPKGLSALTREVKALRTVQVQPSNSSTPLQNETSPPPMGLLPPSAVSIPSPNLISASSPPPYEEIKKQKALPINPRKRPKKLKI